MLGLVFDTLPFQKSFLKLYSSHSLNQINLLMGLTSNSHSHLHSPQTMHPTETNPHFHRPLQPNRQLAPQDPSSDPPQPDPDPYSDPTSPRPPPPSAQQPRLKKNRQYPYPPPPPIQSPPPQRQGQGSQSQLGKPPPPRLKKSHRRVPNTEPAAKSPEQTVHQSRPRVQIQDPSNEDNSRRNQQNILLMPLPRQTNPLMWFGAVFCAIFWVLVIVAGLVILIVYLIFRPKTPRFDVATANLNAAYLDMGYLLNADLNLLANFTNPNKKVSVDFSSMILYLYYGNTLVATQFVPPFSASKQGSHMVNVHMLSSQVRLPILESLRLQKQIEMNGIKLELRGIFRARSNFGSLLRYSYWLHTYCRFIVGGPPGGVLIRSKCITKH